VAACSGGVAGAPQVVQNLRPSRRTARHRAQVFTPTPVRRLRNRLPAPPVETEADGAFPGMVYYRSWRRVHLPAEMTE
jgi:hypothetical protein